MKPSAMVLNMQAKWQWTGLLLAVLLCCSGCQSLLPKAQGLATTTWLAQEYQRQDQLEVEWNKHSFSFLLYQQQQQVLSVSIRLQARW